jgi:cysteine desulfurase
MIKLRQLDQQLLRSLATRIPGLSLNGHPSKRLPGHLNLMIRDADSESMVLMLDTRGIAVSIGSSCASHAFKPSHVLLAIGRTSREAQSSLLITMGASTTEMEIEQVKDVLPDIVEQLRDVAGVAV